MYSDDSRIVMTLDAGGTYFEFSAIQGNKEVAETVILPSTPDNLDDILTTLIAGFKGIEAKLTSRPVAISFAFPGPADYENGIIGDLPNFPAFRNGVALGPFLKEKFNLPVFINNDGNLFAYGEALAGALPDINLTLKNSGSSKEYRNLLGVTLGTGFGAGVVIDKTLLTGDNGCGGDVWCSANRLDNALIAEEGVSIRAVKRVYRELSGVRSDLTPRDIFEIAEGNIPGDQKAAIASFEELGKSAGYTLAEFLNIVDGIVVIGGGISKAGKYFLPAMMEEMRGMRRMVSGNHFPRLQMQTFDLTNGADREEFILDKYAEVRVPGSDKVVRYNTIKKTGITISSLGTGRAVALGAYAFALMQIDNKLK